MIDRAELRRLQTHRDYPSVSLLTPTHRTAPANKRDRIVVKNLVSKAIERLHKEFSKREVAAVVKSLEGLVAKLDWQHLEDGLALFASRDEAHAITLPFKVKARVQVDATFATRDLVFTLNRTARYRVLVLTEKPTRLYEARARDLTEYTRAPFPLEHTGPGGRDKLPGGKGVNASAVRDDAHRQFFRRVDEALEALQKVDRQPVVLVGIERYLAFYQEIARDPDSIIGMITNSDANPNPATLGKTVWPVFQSGSTLRRSRALARLSEAVRANRHASGMHQVWRAAFEKRVQVLLVEQDFSYPADLGPEGATLLPFTGKGEGAMDDAVDELIERVMADGGEVFFYEPGTLDTHQQIAGILRY
jgi:hypothetical protein